MTTATTIRDLRLKRGLTQAGLGALVGWNKSQVCRLEGGKVEPKLESLRKLASALRVRPERLMR